MATTKGSHRILVALDGSSQSDSAVHYLAEFFPPDALNPVLLHISSRLPDSLWDWANDPVVKAHPTKLALGECTAPLDRCAEDPTHDHRDDAHDPCPSDRFPGETDWPGFIRQARMFLMSRGVPDSSIEIKIKEKCRGIARDIIEESAQGYEALVVGGTGVGGIKGLVLGGTTVKLLGRITDLPLGLVSGKPAPGGILVAVDASPACTRAVDFVASLAANNPSRILLFHAIRCPNLPVDAPDVPTLPSAADLIQRASETIEPILDSYRRKLGGVGFDPNRVNIKLVSGVQSRARAIVTEAKVGGYGTIVMGRRGLSKVEEFFMGRVTNKTIHLAENSAVWVIN